MQLRRFLYGLLLVPALASAHHPKKHEAEGSTLGLRNATVLIIRHAEKPAVGNGLDTRGDQRADAYASYFDPLTLADETLQPQRLIATSDSKDSERPRLTLTPLAARLHLPIEQPFADNQVDKLVDALRQQNQASVVLIAWHHGKIDDLIGAFGANTASLLDRDRWPDDVYNWVVVLHFDEQGQLMPSRSHLVHEQLLPGD